MGHDTLSLRLRSGQATVQLTRTGAGQVRVSQP